MYEAKTRNGRLMFDEHQSNDVFPVPDLRANNMTDPLIDDLTNADVTDGMLKRWLTLEHSSDVPVRFIRCMAGELLRRRKLTP